MNKIISINIGGVIFHIEEDAYQVLLEYLQSVSRYFRSTEGSKEIITDIESRIAEMLQEKLKGKKEALVMEDIDDVVHRMGRPQEFADAEGEEYAEESDPTAAETVPRNRGRLFRDPDDKVLGGVCSGISARFNLDPVWLRLAFALAVILYGTGFLLYIILWIIIPEAKTPAEKLEMRGEEVTISNIERSFKKEFESIKKKFGKVGEESEVHFHHWRGKAHNGLSSAGEVFKKLLYILITLIGLGGLAIMVMLLLSLFGVAAFASPLISPMVFIEDWQFIMGIISISLLLLIPVIFLVYTGLRLLLHRQTTSSWVGQSMLGLWIIGFIGALTLTGLIIAEFSSFKSVKKQIPVSAIGYETLYIDITEADKEQMHNALDAVWLDFLGTLYIHEDHIGISNVRLEVIQSPDSLAHLSIYRSARGRTPDEATANAENITVDFHQNDSTLFLGALMDLGDHNMFRNQKVQLLLSIPEGKKVAFSPNTSVITDDLDNWEDEPDFYSGNTWEMKKGNLICLTCHDSMRETMAVTRDFITGDFESLTIEDNLRVVFRSGNTTSISIAGNQNILSYLDIKQNGDNLLLRYNGRHWKSHALRRSQNSVIYLCTPRLRNMELSDNVDVEFSGNISNNLNIKMHALSKLRLETNSPNATIWIRMEEASKANMKGAIAELESHLEDLAHLDAKALAVTEVRVNAEDASHGEVYALQKLNGKIEDAAKLEYKGNPEISSELEDAGRIFKVN